MVTNDQESGGHTRRDGRARHGGCGGCDKSGEYNKSYAENTRVEYKACVNIDLAPDRCSGWSTDYA